MLYTTIPYAKLKARLASLIKDSFFNKNGKRRYQYLVINKGTDSGYFVKEYSHSKFKYTENDIISMVNFLIDNIYVEFGGVMFQQTIGIPMGTNCAPLLADLFLYTYDCGLDCDIYLFRNLQVMCGTSTAGNAHQIQST